MPALAFHWQHTGACHRAVGAYLGRNLAYQWGWLWLLPLAGYGCAWIGHYVYQKNRPATFTHPLYSLRGDWVMYGQMLRGKLRF